MGATNAKSVPLGASLGHRGGIVGASRAVLGAFLEILRCAWGAFGRSWDALGATLGRLGVDLGASWVIVDVLGGLLGGILGVSWGLLGALGGFLGALGGIWELVMHSQHAESPIHKTLSNCSETLNNCLLGTSWEHLGDFLGALGGSWGRFGALRGLVVASLGVLGRLGAAKGRPEGPRRSTGSIWRV